MPRTSVVLTTTVLTVTGLSAATVGVPAHADVPTCDGKPATVVGPGPHNVTTGTPGNDVIVTVAEVANGFNGRINAGEGDDTVCIVAGTGPVADPEKPTSFIIDTGAGNDTVHVQEPRDTSSLTTILGAGSDTYVGNDRAETVLAGIPTSTGAIVDADQDTISTAGGTDAIRTGTAGTVNTDAISTGPGRDEVRHAGTGTTLDNGPAIDATTGAEDGDRLVLSGDDWNQRHVTINDRTMTATGDNGEILRWNNVRVFDVRTDSPVDFVGSDASEVVHITPTVAATDRASVPVHVTLNGGDDHLYLTDGIVPGRVDGGAGTDYLEPTADDSCGSLRATLDDAMICRSNIATTSNGTPGYTAGPTYRLALDGWESYGIFHATRVAVVNGTRHADTVFARARRTTINGLSGNDTLGTHPYEPSYRSTINGGSGADLLMGGEGRDTFHGGRGADILKGRDGRDRLFGDKGRDIARGHGGRDHCVAEVRRSCEN